MQFSELSGYELIGLANSISILLSNNFNTDEINSLSAFFSALGDNLALLSSSPTKQ